MKNITKYILALLLTICSLFLEVNAQIAINENGNAPDSSAMLDISSTNKGLLIPRMDSTARSMITNPVEGLLVYDESSRSFWYFREEWTALNQDVNIEFDGNAIIVKQPLSFENVEDVVSNVSPDEDESTTISGEVWQSFTPTVDGELSRIRVILSEGDDPIFDGGYMRIYEGEGVAGNLLAEVAVAAETSSDPNISFDGASVTLQKDSIYTFSLQDTVNNRWLQYYTSGYAGGRASFNSTRDLFFSTFMNFDSTYIHEAITFDTTGATYSMNLNAVDTIFFSDGTYQITALPDPNGFSDQMLTTNANGVILWSDLVTNTDHQMIDTFQLDSTILALSLENDNEAAQTVDLSSLQDNLGDHTSTQNIATNGFYISNDGEEEGIFVDTTGRVGIGTNSPTDYLEVPMGVTDGSPQRIISNLAEDEVESIEVAWQSYTATINGTLGTISIPSAGFTSTFWTVTIYEGEGITGTVLGSLSASTNYDFSSLNIEQVANGIYTFSILISGGEFDPYSNSDYDGGISSLGTDRDLAFELFINPSIEGTFSVGENGVLINDYGLPLADGTSGQFLQTDGSGNVNWADQQTDTDNQKIDKLNLSGTTLEISLEDDGESDQTVDLSSIDTDTDNQKIDKLNLSGTTLEISLEDDGESDQTVDLSSIDTDTDNQTIDKLNLNGTTLELSLEDDGESDQTVNLASINTDNQTVDKFELSGNTLLISLEDDNQSDISVDLTPLIDDLVPVGTIQMWPTSTAPSGWLICNGSSFNASTYPELNSVLGGNTLPNFNGRFPLGAGNSGTTGSTSHSIKSTGGEEQHVLTINEMPAHSHGVTYSDRSKDGNGNNVSDLGSSGKTETTSSTGGSQAHNNMPPFYTINFIIKAE